MVEGTGDLLGKIGVAEAKGREGIVSLIFFFSFTRLQSAPIFLSVLFHCNKSSVL